MAPAEPPHGHGELSDEDIERISQRTAEVLFHKLMRRLAKAAAVGETLGAMGPALEGRPPCRPAHPRVQPTAEDYAAVDSRRKRKGVY